MAAESAFSYCCGSPVHPGDSACPACGTGLLIAASEPCTIFATGFIGRGKSALQALLSGDASTTRQHLEDGTVTTVGTTKMPKHFVLVELARGESRATALWAACDSEIGFLPTEPLSDAIASTELVDIAHVRRTARELSQLGASAALLRLPLLNHYEREWWAACADLNVGRWASARTRLQSMPATYQLATASLLWLSRQDANFDGELANAALAKRLGSSPRAKLDALLATFADPEPAASWLAAGAPSDCPPGEVALRRSALVDILVASGHEDLHGWRIDVPLSIPESVLDDLIDRGAEVTATGAPAEDVPGLAGSSYFRARVEPWELSADELNGLGFNDEKARRLLVNQQPIPNDLPVDDPVLTALVRLAQTSVVDEVLRARNPSLVTHLQSFFSAPSVETLVPTLCSDPSLWQVLANDAGRDSVAWSAERGTPEARFLGWNALVHAREALYSADWSFAVHAAKQALRLNSEEGARDEALNLLSCAHWQLGNDTQAKQALLDALEGSRNPSLQVNLGVISASDDPETAAIELARLVSEASFPELRVAAATRAVMLWATDEAPWISESEIGGMPETLRVALRKVIVDNIDVEQFRPLVKLAAAVDSEWLASSEALAGSPNSASLEAQLYSARATGPSEFLDALKRALSRKNCPEWVIDERDQFLDTIISGGFEDLSSVAAFFCFLSIERELPITEKQRLVLVPLGILGLCATFTDDQDDESPGAPDDRFTDLLYETFTQANASSDFESLEGLYQLAWHRLGLVQVRFSAASVDALVNAFNSIMDEIRYISRHRLNKIEVNSTFRRILNECERLENQIRWWVPWMSDDEALGGFTTSMLEHAVATKNHIERAML